MADYRELYDNYYRRIYESWDVTGLEEKVGELEESRRFYTDTNELKDRLEAIRTNEFLHAELDLRINTIVEREGPVGAGQDQEYRSYAALVTRLDMAHSARNHLDPEEREFTEQGEELDTKLWNERESPHRTDQHTQERTEPDYWSLLAWDEGMRDRQTQLGRLWDRVTGQDKLKAQIEDLQEHSENTAYEMRDLGYAIMLRDNQIEKLQEENMGWRETLDQATSQIGERMGPTPPTPAFDQVVQEAAAIQPRERELELER